MTLRKKIAEELFREAEADVKQLEIDWLPPDFEHEKGEYFKNDPTRRYLASLGICFENEKELYDFLQNGRPRTITRTELLARGKNLTVRPEDFQNELEDPEYRKHFEKIERKLLEHGKLSIPMPIVIELPDNKIYGFAGNRRTNLAWKYNLPLTSWVVKAPPDLKFSSSENALRMLANMTNKNVKVAVITKKLRELKKGDKFVVVSSDDRSVYKMISFDDLEGYFKEFFGSFKGNKILGVRVERENASADKFKLFEPNEEVIRAI